MFGSYDTCSSFSYIRNKYNLGCLCAPHQSLLVSSSYCCCCIDPYIAARFGLIRRTTEFSPSRGNTQPSTSIMDPHTQACLSANMHVYFNHHSFTAMSLAGTACLATTCQHGAHGAMYKSMMPHATAQNYLGGVLIRRVQSHIQTLTTCCAISCWLLLITSRSRRRVPAPSDELVFPGDYRI